jgi:hypothetical protein
VVETLVCESSFGKELAMKFFNATKITVVGPLSLLLLLAVGELTGLLNAAEAKPAQVGPKRHRLAATLETTQ